VPQAGTGHSGFPAWARRSPPVDVRFGSVGDLAQPGVIPGRLGMAGPLKAFWGADARLSAGNDLVTL
jgi:hypothetical protein